MENSVIGIEKTYVFVWYSTCYDESPPDCKKSCLRCSEIIDQTLRLSWIIQSLDLLEQWSVDPWLDELYFFLERTQNTNCVYCLENVSWPEKGGRLLPSQVILFLSLFMVPSFRNFLINLFTRRINTYYAFILT